ncbi:MAG: hypothetical protein AAGC67_13880 [Myxococcota bacterium]
MAPEPIVTFDPLAYAQEQIVPLLEILSEGAEADGKADQAAFFGRIHAGMTNARDAVDLAEPFMELSASAFMGFDFSPPTAMLLDQVLIYASQLSEVLSLDEDEIH